MSDPKAALAWGKRLDRFDRADVTVAQFCLQEGVSPSSFYQWRRRLHRKRSQEEQSQPRPIPQFLPVSFPSPPMSPAPLAAAVKSLMTVDLPGGIRIRFEIPADHEPAERSEDRP